MAGHVIRQVSSYNSLQAVVAAAYPVLSDPAGPVLASSRPGQRHPPAGAPVPSAAASDGRLPDAGYPIRHLQKKNTMVQLSTQEGCCGSLHA